MLLNELMPRYDVVERHATLVRAGQADVYDAIRAAHLTKGPVTRLLLTLRTLPSAVGAFLHSPRRARWRGRLGDLERAGFCVIAERAPEEIVLGLTGRFWSLRGGGSGASAADFTTGPRPGFALAGWNFTVVPRSDGRTELRTETRVVCAPEVRGRFRAYWLLIRPGSGLIRREMLRAIRRHAERRAPMSRRGLGTVMFFVSTLPLVACGGLARHSQHNGGTDPRGEMIAALQASGAHASLGDRAGIFDRFVGTWDVDYTFYTPDGRISRRSGEVRFGWILAGLAMQDVWITYSDSGARDLGTTVRFYDAGSATWRIVWIYLPRAIIATFTGGNVDDRIVFHGPGEDGSLVRWSFNDIQPNSFVWRGERSYDKGQTWRLTGEYRMTRRTTVFGHGH